MNHSEESLATPFDLMTAEQKRVAIANDVIQQLKMKRFKAEAGVYLIATTHNLYQPDIYKMDLLADDVKECRVCAMGGLLMGLVDCNAADFRMEGNTSFTDEKGAKTDRFDLESHQEMEEKLQEYFDAHQLYLIEYYFEGWAMRNYTITDRNGLDMYDAMRFFYTDFELEAEFSRLFTIRHTDEERMMVIMQNIIDHNGTFNPKALAV